METPTLDMASNGMPAKIDVHAHFLPSFYQEACRANGHANPDGMPALPTWSPEAHLALMDKLGTRKSILSISSPGTHLIASNDALATKLTRDCNAYAAALKTRFPARFGYFASLPLPDIPASLAEITRAIAEGCDGFVLETNTHGHYLGDALLDPIFDELDRRGALLFIHPTTPMCACQPDAQDPTPRAAAPLATRWPNPMLEFFFDTARVVTNLFMSGTMARCRNIRIILPHLGGAMPPLLSRWSGFSSLVPGPWIGVPEEEVMEVFRTRVWFDLAGFAFPSQTRILVDGLRIPHSRLCYGSDFPFTKADGVQMLLGRMDAGVREMFTKEQIEDVYCRNAERLLAMRK